jgi:hypothetical protein
MPMYTVTVAGPSPTATVSVWVEDDTTDPEEIEWEICNRVDELDAGGKIDWELGDSIDMEILDYFLDD